MSVWNKCIFVCGTVAYIQLTQLLSQLKVSFWYSYILYNGKFWRPLNLGKRSESATYIIWRFWILANFVRVHHVLWDSWILANFKFGDRLFNHQTKTTAKVSRFKVFGTFLLQNFCTTLRSPQRPLSVGQIYLSLSYCQCLHIVTFLAMTRAREFF